ncbi:MAG: hypothetical protein AAF985_08970 [Bacteroidota bacterium]
MWVILINDFKVVFRAPALRVFFFIPFLFIALVNGFFPYLCERYPVVQDYMAYFLMGATVQTSTMFGFIYSMIFIDEKDTQVAKVYGILPVSKTVHLLGRLSIPFIVATFFTWLMLQFQPFYALSIWGNLMIAFLSAFLAPFIALGVALIARNKVEGMTWLKVFNTPVIAPIGAFFLSPAYQFLFGILPTHWSFQALNDLILQNSYALNWSIGLLYYLLLLTGMIRLFVRRHYI